MAHFAKVVDGVVTQVIVAEQDFIDTLEDKDTWIQTSYNTHGGVHKLDGTPLRKNYAGIGFTYDSIKDAFIPPKAYQSWVLNEQSCLWEPPIPYPADGNLATPPGTVHYKWDEQTTNWVEQ
jgi:hypothetical protein